DSNPQPTADPASTGQVAPTEAGPMRHPAPAAHPVPTSAPTAETPTQSQSPDQAPSAPATSRITERELQIADATAAPMGPPGDAPGSAQLNPKYTFDTFVIGASNRFAHAAAFAVAEAPAKAYIPLFIYGDSGLGKTHLLHAIGYYATQLFPEIRVKYVSSEEFVNDFINTIGSSKTSNALRPAFQRRYREVDI